MHEVLVLFFYHNEFHDMSFFFPHSPFSFSLICKSFGFFFLMADSNRHGTSFEGEGVNRSHFCPSRMSLFYSLCLCFSFGFFIFGFFFPLFFFFLKVGCLMTCRIGWGGSCHGFGGPEGVLYIESKVALNDDTFFLIFLFWLSCFFFFFLPRC